MHETIEEQLKRNFYNNREIKEKLDILENRVLRNEMTPFAAAGKMLKMFSKIK
ncbi:MAG: hypothetical protein L3J54_00520 [Draconibacterium sp.]|nr:hypothetical protein [Draconibacterium sp.]